MKRLSKTVLATIEYKYDSKEERENHVKIMESDGFQCDGQVKKSDSFLSTKEEDSYWYAKFTKYLISE